MQLLTVLLLSVVAVTASGTAKHKVHFQNTPILSQEAQKLRAKDGFQMVNSNKQYLCYMPQVESVQATADNFTVTPNHLLVDQAVSLLEKSFKLNECVFKFAVNGEYWTYAYCFGDKVIQFHHDLEYYRKTKQFKPEYPAYVYKLGMFDAKPKAKNLEIANQLPWNPEQINLNARDFEIIDDFVNPFSRSILPAENLGTEPRLQKLIKHVLKHGDICDLTGFSRTIDVIYKCDPSKSTQAQILDVHEIKSCEYQMIIHVPQLCLIAEFQPIEAAEEIVDITCREVVSDTEYQEAEVTRSEENIDTSEFLDNTHIQTFLGQPERYPLSKEHTFAVDHDFKISLANYNLLPFGDGFFSAISKDPVGSNDVYFDHRHILLYNGVLEPNSIEVLESFGRVLLNAVERKLLAPVDQNEVHPSQLLIKWSDSFILWFEMYNSVGEFVNMVRVERDGKEREPMLTLNFIDPVTMLDEQGRKWTIREYQGTILGVNYEKFERSSKKGESRKERRRRAKKEAETDMKETKTVTDTYIVYATDEVLSNDYELIKEKVIQILQKQETEGEAANEGDVYIAEINEDIEGEIIEDLNEDIKGGIHEDIKGGIHEDTKGEIHEDAVEKESDVHQSEEEKGEYGDGSIISPFEETEQQPKHDEL